VLAKFYSEGHLNALLDA